MTPLEYMESQVIKRRLNHDRELARGAPEEQLHNIRQKIGYYEAACDALRGRTELESICDLCAYNPPSSFGGKPCTMCPATLKEETK